MRASRDERRRGHMELYLLGWGEFRVPVMDGPRSAWDSWPEGLNERWPDFKPWEFRCHDLSNMMVLDMEMLDGVQQIRRLVGHAIDVLSGFRTVAHNRKEEGSPKSQHLLGKASDLACKHISVERLNTAAQRVPVFARGGIGVYLGKGFVHVDSRGKKARWRM